MLQLTDYGMDDIKSDTVVMNNRGYWQLRGNMGVYEISVSEDSPGKALITENSTVVSKVPVCMLNEYDSQLYQWNNLEEKTSLRMTNVEVKKKEPEVESFTDMLKSKLFSSNRAKKSHIGDAINDLAKESEEE